MNSDETTGQIVEETPATAEPVEAITAAEPVEAGMAIPAELPILPLRGQVVYPFGAQPLLIGQERSITLIDDAMHGERLIGLVGQPNAEVEQVPPEELYTIGVVARILQLLRRPDGAMMIAVQGLQRIRVQEYTKTAPYLVARVEEYADVEEVSLEVEALKRNVVSLFQRLATLAQVPEDLVTAAINMEDARQLAYLIGSYLRMDIAQRQAILEAPTVRARLEQLSGILSHELEVLELGKRIQGQAQEEMTKAQREYFLREQLKAIQKELGEEDETQAEINQLRERVEGAGLPPEVRKDADRELGRLARLPAASPEHSVIRTYLDWLLALPWNVSTGEGIDVAAAHAALDADHYGLEKIKDRILDYLAVRKMKREQAAELAASAGEVGESAPGDPANREPILCLVGPPGVGKTSLGQSIARALGRHFTRMSLGGIHDESEIRGHRRTYIGAMPGRIVQAIRRAEANDPVMMLDEIDKVGNDWRGDPSSALLEVLDPEQNKDFRDNYLDVPFDLSRVMFIATANTMETIPAPLLDRMEVLQLSGYTEEEKVQIATRYLVPKELRANGLKADQLTIEDDALRAIITGYTREAGVRNLERQIGTVCRKVARRFAEGTQHDAVVVSAREIADYLGRQVHFAEAAERTDRAGVATGLVWTPVGGDIVFIEAAAVPGAEERLILTGQLGDVMKESAQTALTCVRTYSEELGIDPAAWQNAVVHVHVPAGAVPKDGPSAGVTMATAVASLMTGRPVRSDVAMTGEITLRGKVLPVGGVKEKVLAAHRAGIRTVILPRRNERDLEDLPADLRADLTVVPVDEVTEVWREALTKLKAVAA